MVIISEREVALKLDEDDKLKHFREKFHFPDYVDDIIYLNGNSLGLQPKDTEKYVLKELKDWKKYGVEGHFESETPWLPYHEFLSKPMAKIVGAMEDEVVIMNTLTVNLHLLMVSFYNPKGKRNKILIEKSAFPSDIYAIKSQIQFRGLDPKEVLIELENDMDVEISNQKIKEIIEMNKDTLSLIMLGGVNYYSGQTFDMKSIVEWGHNYGITVGFDLAHAVGNVELNLHDWNVDFAVFCTYKYLNSGPGSVGGVFIHRKMINKNVHRFAGWWGHDKETRFLMEENFKPINTAEGWQLSNPPILSLAAILASMEIFEEAKMTNLIEKRKKMITFAREILLELDDKIIIITPNNNLSGSQLSIRILNHAKEIYQKLKDNGVVCDWREPDIIRVAFVPLYNSFMDILKFKEILMKVLKRES
ncbi:kynureninase [archaeon]|nr:kynureninase [archaeon]NDB55560.1 kynureninase [archaeon]NDB79412.1 kynureninase [archaeon]